MNHRNKIRNFTSAALLCAIGSVAGTAVAQQQQPEVKAPVVTEKSSGRDPFKKFEPVVKLPRSAAKKLEAPTIQMRIERYRAQKQAAANAHVAAPKPTTALLLNEIQVTGIFRTPRGWSAMVEATPLTPKLSYVIYPGEMFFDGQLVAIEENRLIFRRDMVMSDGRREQSVEAKPLRAPDPVQAMTAAKTSAGADAPATETAKPVPEKQ